MGSTGAGRRIHSAATVFGHPRVRPAELPVPRRLVVGVRGLPSTARRPRREEEQFCDSCGAFSNPDLDLYPCCGAFASTGATVSLPAFSKCQTCACDDGPLLPPTRGAPGSRLRVRVVFPIRTGALCVPHFYEADIVAKGGPVFRLAYAPAATPLRVNHRWRGSAGNGFLVDFDRGEVLEGLENTNKQSARPRRLKRVRL